jgi:hypothetical protein
MMRIEECIALQCHGQLSLHAIEMQRNDATNSASAIPHLKHSAFEGVADFGSYWMPPNHRKG